MADELDKVEADIDKSRKAPEHAGKPKATDTATDDPADNRATPEAKKKAADRQKLMVGVGIVGVVLTYMLLRGGSSSSGSTASAGNTAAAGDPLSYEGGYGTGGSDPYGGTSDGGYNALVNDLTREMNRNTAMETRNSNLLKRLRALTKQNKKLEAEDKRLLKRLNHKPHVPKRPTLGGPGSTMQRAGGHPAPIRVTRKTVTPIKKIK